MGRHKRIDDADLLEVARTVFREQGQSASTREIAQRAGISQAVLFQRFATKDALFFASMMPPQPDITHLLGPRSAATTMTAASAEKWVYVTCARVAQYLAGAIPVVLHLVTHPAFGAHVLTHAHGGGMHAHLVAELAARLAVLHDREILIASRADVVADAMVALSHGAAMPVAIGSAPKGHEVQAAEAAARVLLAGLRPSASRDAAVRTDHVANSVATRKT
jgi:AcrR family transcriptional regulator